MRRLTLPLLPLSLSHCCCCFAIAQVVVFEMGMLTMHFVCQSVDDEAVPPLQLIVSLDSCVCVLCKLIFLFSSFVNWQIDIVYGMGYPHTDWPPYESSIFC